MSKLAQKLGFTRKYSTISAAVDWFAFYDDGETVRLLPVVVWATCDDSDGGSCVVGLVAEPHFQELVEAEDVDSFDCYLHRAEIEARLARIEAPPAAAPPPKREKNPAAN